MRTRINLFGKFVMLLLVVLIANSCQLRSKKALITSKIQKTAKLATQEVVVSKYVKFKDNKRIFSFTNKPNSLFYIEAYVKYGVDFRKVGPDDVIVKGDILQVSLPPIEVLNFSIPLENMKQFHFDKDNVKPKGRRRDLQRTDEIMRAAQVDIEETIKLMNLEESAQERTRLYMVTLLEQLGFGAVSIQFKEKEL